MHKLLIPLPLLLAACSHNGPQIVNIDASAYGFSYAAGGGSDPAPAPGAKIKLIHPASGPLKVHLAAGTYMIANAAGQSGATANFTGWRYNSGNNWVWSWVMANDQPNPDGSHTVIAYGEAGETAASQEAIASQPAVKNFSATVQLAADTTVDFMIRDYDVGDNAGGVALKITRADGK